MPDTSHYQSHGERGGQSAAQTSDTYVRRPQFATETANLGLLCEKPLLQRDGHCRLLRNSLRCSDRLRCHSLRNNGSRSLLLLWLLLLRRLLHHRSRRARRRGKRLVARSAVELGHRHGGRLLRCWHGHVCRCSLRVSVGCGSGASGCGVSGGQCRERRQRGRREFTDEGAEGLLLATRSAGSSRFLTRRLRHTQRREEKSNSQWVSE
jgi:hypothetical protein